MIEILLYILLTLVAINISLSFLSKKTNENPNHDIKESLLRFDTKLENSLKYTNEQLSLNRTDFLNTANSNREEQRKTLNDLKESIDKRLKNIQDDSTKQLDKMRNTVEEKLQNTSNTNREELRKTLNDLKESIDKRLKNIQDDSTKQLDKMRNTVDEKLQKTLNDRISKSFEQVSKQLADVHKGLGDMQSIATDVGGLKKVLGNVKTRGVIGEYQIKNILEEILPKEHYGENVKTKVGTNDHVEFAIKLPGRTEDKTVWLPIDSKFPNGFI